MDAKKEKAIKLRRLGNSYREISQKITVPKSTLSGWLSNKNWSKNIEKTLRKEAIKSSTVRMHKLNKIRGKNLQNIYEKAESEAREEFEKLKYHPLFLSSLMLYWGEGDRVNKYHVRIGNSDPLMLRVFILFLTKICQMPQEKLRVGLLLYKDMEDGTERKFWSENIRLPLENFHKSSILPSRHKNKKSEHGVCIVNCSSTYLKKKILIWLDLMKKEILSESYYKYQE